MPVKDVPGALDFYTRCLGFRCTFTDREVQPRYAGIQLDRITIHLQWHDASEWVEGVDRPLLRILCDKPGVLYDKWKHLVNPQSAGLRDTPWGTREFGVYDPDGNGLIFYCNR